MAKKQTVESGVARVYGGQPSLPRGRIVSVECDITKGLHAFSIVGLPDKAVEESKDRVAAAIKNPPSFQADDFESPKRSNKKIVVSLAPAELKKEGALFDLPIALAFLLASEQLVFDPAGKLFAGELSLNGNVCPVRGALSLAIAAREAKFKELYVPAENADEAALVSGIAIFPVRTLSELVRHFAKKEKFSLARHLAQKRKHAEKEGGVPTLDDIRGQESAKRALQIAAAGRHNIALYGPPGTGKTMLARAAAALLPPLSEEEVLEVTAIHSLAGALRAPAVFFAPFRSPHHTSSYASLIGGGTIPHPGEVTLAHRGILFVDEFPEFHRDVVQALREPLEDGKVSVSRAKGSAVYPAQFMLIAALNPCPCGHAGTPRCECMPHVVEKYRRKISGPVADRIDMWVTVPDIPPEMLSQKSKGGGGEADAARGRIAAARTLQNERFKKAPRVSVNAEMKPRDIETYAKLTQKAEDILVSSAHSMKLSARGFHRTIKVARTVADLVGSDTIEPSHMLEALQYRTREL